MEDFSRGHFTKRTRGSKKQDRHFPEKSQLPLIGMDFVFILVPVRDNTKIKAMSA